MEKFESVLRILPPQLQKALQQEDLSGVSELRLRAGQAPTLLRGCREWLVEGFCAPVEPEQLQTIVQTATGQSAYAAESLRMGYFTLPGGHRLGLCGEAAVHDGGVVSIRRLSSLNIRLARECPVSVPAELLRGSVLLLGPPGSGKTTLLRAAIRTLSDEGIRVCAADERGELAACRMGVPQLRVGAHTDVLTGVPKAQALLQMLRTMNPQVLACDEITAPEDLTAMEQCSYCGVRLLATAHAARPEDLRTRPLYRRLLQLRIFDSLLVLTPDRQFSRQEVPEC